MLLDLYLNTLEPEIGGTLLLALHGTGGAGPVPERRPKATATVRLARILEGHAQATHAKAGTYAKPLRAAGATPIPAAPVFLPGGTTAVQCRSMSTGRAITARAAAGSHVLNGSTKSRGGYITAEAAAVATVVSAYAASMAKTLNPSAGGRSSVLLAQSTSTCERVRARGTRNVSVLEAAVVARIFDTRR